MMISWLMHCVVDSFTFHTGGPINFELILSYSILYRMKFNIYIVIDLRYFVVSLTIPAAVELCVSIGVGIQGLIISWRVVTIEITSWKLTDKLPSPCSDFSDADTITFLIILLNTCRGPLL